MKPDWHILEWFGIRQGRNMTHREQLFWFQGRNIVVNISYIQGDTS